ncbi:MAG: MCE family protein [Marmoricola sp.]
MAFLDKRTSGDFVRLIIFIAVTTLATGVLVVVIGNISFQSTHEYKAIFKDASGLYSGDDVRIAGVRVGTVKGVDIVNRNEAQVTFDVSDDATLNKSETATIRYRNLVGQRYVSLAEGSGPATALPHGATIPISQTFPALDLTTLFNGFKPLFAALTPEDINQLSYEMIQVFQGEGNNLNGLLQTTASITNALADRDQVIGSLITNLNGVLSTVNQRNSEFNSLITQFQSFLRGLAADRNQLLGPLDSISQLTLQTADLISGIRPGFVADVKNLRAVAGNLNRNAASIDRDLQILPIKLNKVGRTAEYGTFFNFYLCQLTGRIIVGGTTIPIPPLAVPGQTRCDLGKANR